MKKNIMWWLAVLVFVTVGGFIVFRNLRPMKKVTVETKWFNQAQFTGVFVAKEQGFFFGQETPHKASTGAKRCDAGMNGLSVPSRP